MWLELLAATEDVELVGVIDLSVEGARSAVAHAGVAGVAVAATLAELLETTTADALVNVTIPAAHHAVTSDALLRGLAVLSEKPVAPTIAEALSLAATSEATGRLLMVSQSRRYYNSIAAFRDQIAGLGRIGTMSTEFALAPRFGGFRDEMDQPLLVDMAIHAFDAARYLLAADPVSVYCVSSNPAWSWYRGDATTTAIFEFEGDVRYVYNGSWCSEGFETSWNGSWRVNGAGGTSIWNGEDAPAVDRGNFEGEVGSSVTVADLAERPETLAGALEEFLDALRTGRSPSGEVHANIPSLAMVEAAVVSTESGSRVLVADVLEDGYAEALEHEAIEPVRDVLAGWTSAAIGLAAHRRASH